MALVIVLVFNCSRGGLGRFSFYALHDLELSAIEKKYFRPKVFKVKKDPIFFYEGETLWFCYYPSSPLYKQIYIISLSQKSIGWFEIDLKNQLLSPQNEALVSKFNNLNVGRYLIRIFKGLDIVDRIEFDVLPSKETVVLNYDEVDIPLEIETYD